MDSKWIYNSPLILSILYAGILLGVSFLATPIKFSAPLLTLPVALDVGRVTFHTLIKLEWLLACTCLLALLLNPISKLAYILIFSIIIILTIQSFWFLPDLDQRAILIQQGHVLKESYYHFFYIILDCTKLIFLFGITFSKIHSSN